MKNVIYITAMREGYAIDQIHRTMTVGELIDCLSEFPEDAQIYLSHDRGYTYGGITERIQIEHRRFLKAQRNPA